MLQKIDKFLRNILFVQKMKEILSSKIHKASVTESDLNYVGSITVDEELLEKSGLIEWQKVLVVSNTSGARLETYILKGKRKSGVICTNGAASHLIKKGEEIIIMGFEITDKKINPKCILVDKNNKFLEYLTEQE